MFALKMLRQRGPSVRSEIESAIGQLHNLGILNALMEIMIESNPPAPATDLIDYNALRAAWTDGFTACLKNLTEFTDRYLTAGQESMRAPDFGAGERLLAVGDITPEEYEQTYGRKPPAGIYKQPKPWPTRRSESN
jgi:hypothetical protein